MKNIKGLLHVAGLFSFYCVVVVLLIALTIGFYAGIFSIIVFVILKSYPILGEPWFFIFWPGALLSLVGYKLFKHIRTVRARRRLYWSQTK